MIEAESGSVEIVTEKLTIAVTYDAARGYVGTAPDLRQPVIALSLGGLRARVEALNVARRGDVTLNLDKAARLERDRRRAHRKLPEASGELPG